MTSEKQIEANRRNAYLSTGPKTEEGKKVSRLNATRHGLTGQIDVMAPEDRDAHDRFCSEMVASLAPENAAERQFAHSVAEDHWRLNRARAIENNIFTLACSLQDAGDDTANPDVEEALGQARVFIAQPHRFQLLTIYEQRIHRNMQRNLQQLLDLQANRRALDAAQKAARAEALEEACLLARHAESEGVPLDPATGFPDPNGFVFSTAEITGHIRRTERLKAARQARSSPGNPAIHRVA